MKEKYDFPISSRKDHNRKHSPRGPEEESVAVEKEVQQQRWKRSTTIKSGDCPVPGCGGTMHRVDTKNGSYMECSSCGFRSRAN